MEINKYFKCLCPNKVVTNHFLLVVILDSSYILDEIDEGYLQSLLFDNKTRENVCLVSSDLHTAIPSKSKKGI